MAQLVARISKFLQHCSSSLSILHNYMYMYQSPIKCLWYNIRKEQISRYYTEKNSLVGLNSNFDRKWTNQNFLVKSARILVEIARIPIEIILIKMRILIDFTKNIALTRIPSISTRILINLTRKFWFVHFQSEILFGVEYMFTFSFPKISKKNITLICYTYSRFILYI